MKYELYYNKPLLIHISVPEHSTDSIVKTEKLAKADSDDAESVKSASQQGNQSISVRSSDSFANTSDHDESLSSRDDQFDQDGAENRIVWITNYLNEIRKC